MDATSADRLPDLVNSLADLEEAVVLDIVRKRLEQGDDPLRIIEDCQQGMRLVGKRYEERQYYLSALIVSGEILREVMERVQPIVQNRLSGHSKGRVLLGTVQGDIHDLGKNLVQMLLRCYGFTVYDLGVDVPPAKFVEQACEVRPFAVGLSGLLTASHAIMQTTVSMLRGASDLRESPLHIIIGGQVDEKVCRRTGADDWVTEPMEGVRLCQRLVAGTKEMH